MTADNFDVVYDIEHGDLHVRDGHDDVEIIRVREEILDDAIRTAVIAELESRGYVVLGPYT